MVELDIGQVSKTSMDTTVDKFSVAAKVPDIAFPDQKETFWDYPDSSQYLGYYKEIDQLNSAIKALATWVAGKGIETDAITKVNLDAITGWGEDSFQSIMMSLIISKKVLGDAFAEVIRSPSGTLLNLKPLYTGDMRVVVNGKGLIERYEQRTKNKNNKFQPSEILHLVNDRFANEIHGTSVIEAVKWIIDAKKEAMDTHRKVLKRNLAMGVLYLDSDDATKINTTITKYQEAINKGEVLVLPKDTAELKDTNVTIQSPIEWIRYLDDAFYRAVGVPRVIIEAEGSEASSKVGFLSFDPIFTAEQTLLEQDLWNQLAIRVKFNRPPSLMGVVQEAEAKNTGQTGFQPNDTQVGVTRSE